MAVRSAKKNRKADDEPTLGQTAGSIRSQRLVGVVLGLSLVTMTLVAYLPATRCGFIWDDDFYIENNRNLNSVEGLGRIWFHLKATPQYYPLVFTTFWLEYHVWGLNPAGYHAVNIALHGLGAVLLWRVLRRLHLPGAWLAGALFALHPVHVESVAWVTERKNVLSGVFYFASALIYLRWLSLDQDRAVDRPLRFDYRSYLAALVMFVCALLSKTVTCSLPAAILLVIWWKRGRLAWRDALPLLPFFAVGISMGLLTSWMEEHSVGAIGEQWNLSFVQRFLVAGRAVWFYLGKLVWPHPLIFIYPRWEIDSGQWRQYIHPLAALAGLSALWLARKRVGRGALAAALYFGGTLFPALGFFNVFPMRYSFVADHFQYLASVGPIALAAGVAWTMALRHSRLGARVGIVASAAVLGTLGALTWRQGVVYANAEELWKQTLAVNPRASMAHSNLGLIYQARGDYARAMECYETAIALEPGSPEALCNIGIMLSSQGRAEESYQYFRRAIEAAPNDAHSLLNMAVFLQTQGRYEEAVQYAEEVCRIQPDQARPHIILGASLRSLGRLDEAGEHLRRAVQIRPDSALAHFNLGWTLVQAGRCREAKEEWLAASALQPSWPAPLEFAARMLATHPDVSVRDPRQAVQLAERAAVLTNKKDSRVLDTLAAAYAAAGRFEQAIATAQEALDLAGAGREAESIARHLEGYKQHVRLIEAFSDRDVAGSTGGSF